MPACSESPISGNPSAAVLTLEACAERAGAALACAYSSSAEFDAALIAERRAAGVYRAQAPTQAILATAAGVAAALAVILFLTVVERPAKRKRAPGKERPFFQPCLV